MSKFIDGPAAGVHLSLRRAPIMLRVVHGRGGWDALDQLDDEPKRGESIHVYYQVGDPIAYHLCIRGKGKAGAGFYQMGDYLHWPEQPGDEHLRTNEAWSAWCDTQRSRAEELRASHSPTEGQG